MVERSNSGVRIPSRHRILLIVLALLLSSMGLPRLFAQSDLASIRGSVQDQSGAVIPGISVHLSSTDTGVNWTDVTDASGYFHFEALIRGNYQVKVSAPGFQSVMQSLTLNVSQVQTLNFQLKPGSTTTTVEVTDAAPIVDTATSSTGGIIEGSKITELPLNGRNPTQLALLVPGITRGAYGSSPSGAASGADTWRYGETGGASISANGLRMQANNFELDGLDNNEALVNNIIFLTPVEDMQEFRVTNSVAPAEFGRAGGAIIQNSIKSGSNEFHGSAFLFDRDKIFDASPNYFSPTIAAPTFHRTQYGGTLGGPLLHDRLFMFGGFQGLRMKTPLGVSYSTIPTALERTGNFTELLNSSSGMSTTPPAVLVTGCTTTAGPNGTIYDPLTCQPFPGNIIPAGRMNQASLNYLNAFPLPNNGPAQGNSSLKNNYATNPLEFEHFDDFDIRLDWKATSRDNVFARYSYGQDVLIKQPNYPNLPAGSGSGYNPVHPRGEAAGLTHLFNANMVDEFRFGHIYDYHGYFPPFDNIPLSANLGILNANRNALLGGGAAISGGSSIASTGDGGPYLIKDSNNQFVDSFSWTRGPHTMKFGASIETRQVSFCCASNAKGNFSFGQDFTGFGQSDMLAGFVSSYSIGVASIFYVTNNWETGYYAQDDWKVNRRLTLNLGFRYDLFTYPVEQHNYQSDFDLASLTLQVAGTNGLSRSILQTNRDNFAPRFGFAYDLFGDARSSLRGGYGIFYFPDRGGTGNDLSSNPDFNGSDSYSDVLAQGGYRNTFTGQAASGINDNRLLTTTLPLPTFGNTINRADPLNATLISQPTRMPTSMIQEWNLQLQQQLIRNTSVNIAYVGTQSQHLDSFFNLNAQVFDMAPGTHLYKDANGTYFGSITRGLANGVSKYHGLQVYLNSKMSSMFQYTASYTWSHSLDNSNGAFGTGTSGAGVLIFPNGPNFRANYGSSDQDQRHVFVFSGLGELPFGRGKRFAANVPMVLDEVIGGWHLNAITTLKSGTPVTVTTGDYFYQTAGTSTGKLVSASVTNRADVTGPIHYIKNVKEWFDTTTFAHPAVLNPNGQTSTFIQAGTLGRNQLVGPAYRDLDASLFKDFAVTEKLTAQFRAEAFNLTNTPAFNNPNGSLDGCSNVTTAVCAANLATNSGSFGQINGTHTSSERQLQLALRISF